MFDQLKAMKSLAGLMGNAGELKAKFEAVQKDLESKSVVGESGGGAVRVTVNGKLKMLDVELGSALTTAIGGASEADRATIEKLIVEATNDAMEKAQNMIRDQMASVTGGLNLPGLT